MSYTNVVGLLAQIDVPAPTLDGMPGASMVTSILGWLSGLALAACIGGFLYGVVLLNVGERSGNGGWATRGRQFLISSIVGILLFGSAEVILLTFYNG